MNENPVHPGEFLLLNLLKPLGLSVSDTAKKLNISRQALSNFVNKKSECSYEMAYRLECAFGLEAEHWLLLQQQYSLPQVRKKKLDITRLS